MLKQAFNALLAIHHRKMTLSRPGTAYTSEVKCAPSNFFRNFSAEQDLVSDGREFVMSIDDLASVPGFLPKRGDKLVDPQLGTMTVMEPREIFILGGEIIGYRIRTT